MLTKNSEILKKKPDIFPADIRYKHPNNDNPA